MSQMEWILIIGAVVIPFIAILFVLPKRKKKSKVPPPTTDYVREDKEKETKAKTSTGTPTNSQQPKQVKPPVYMDTDDDFKSYLELRNQRIKPAEPKSESSYVRSTSGDYIPARLRTPSARGRSDKSVAEQIQDLSPELKALIISGVLDKKF